MKAEGTPQPTVHWFKQGAEVVPSEEFIIENFDDGTSVLTIPEIYPDDVGEIICEAHNELGVTQTVTYIDLPGKCGQVWVNFTNSDNLIVVVFRVQ